MRKILNRLRTANGLFARYARTEPAMEIVYRSLLLRELERHKIADTFYPVGSAANHGLLYFLARAMGEFDFGNILELGAGQSSILIDRVAQARERSGRIRTVEHDAAWASRIAAQVRHDVVHVPLKPMRADGQDIAYYDLSGLALGQPIDLLVVDGPPASTEQVRRSRLGAFAIATAHLGQDFVVVVDDCERVGEERLVQLLDAHFRASGVAYLMSQIRALKSQTVFAAGRYIGAAYF